MTDRRNFLTACISGAAWLMGWKPATEPLPIDYGKEHDGTGYVTYSAIPQLKDKHPSRDSFVHSIEAERIDNHLWKVTVEYSDRIEEQGFADTYSMHNIFKGNAYWVRSKP